MFIVHDAPVPDGLAIPVGATRAVIKGEVISRGVDADGRDVLTMIEVLPTGVAAYDSLPLALTPDGPPPTTNIEAAIRELAAGVIAGGVGAQPGLDVLRRVPPRTVTGSLPLVGEGSDAVVTAITEAVADLDRSYVAVQGPPGTGKTYVGSRVVKRLVERGWRIGVVAQSHAVVENFLDAVVEAGLPGDRVGKESKHTTAPGWTALADGRPPRRLPAPSTTASAASSGAPRGTSRTPTGSGAASSTSS